HDDASSSHAGIRGGSLASSVSASGSGIAGTALWGPVDVAISGGTSTGSMAFNLTFQDAGFDAVDSFATFRELRSGLADVTTLLGNATPTGSLSMTLPTTVTPGMTGLTHTPTLSIT